MPEPSEVQFSQRVRKADKWSKPIALFAAMAMFVVTLLATGNVSMGARPANLQMASIIAAAAGIGVRFLIPYRASMAVPESERVDLEEHPATGNFHHGAAGGALVVASVVTTVTLGLQGVNGVPLWAGGISLGASFFLLSELLPR